MKYADSRATLAATANKRHQPPKQHSLIQWRGGCGAFYYTHSTRASQIKKSLFTAGPQFPLDGSCILAALTKLIFTPIDFSPLFMRPTDMESDEKIYGVCGKRTERWKLVFFCPSVLLQPKWGFHSNMVRRDTSHRQEKDSPFLPSTNMEFTSLTFK